MGGYQNDDESFTNYSLSANGGGADFVTKQGGYWYSNIFDFDKKLCFNGEGLILKFVGDGFSRKGGVLAATLQLSAGDCSSYETEITRKISKWSVDAVTGRDVGEVDLSTYKTLFDPRKIHALLVNLEPTNGTRFTIYSISFRFAGIDTVVDFRSSLSLNSLDRLIDHDDSLVKYENSPDGVGAIFRASANSRWYTSLRSPFEPCFSANTKYLRIYGRGMIAKSAVLIAGLMFDEAAVCSTAALQESWVTLAHWVYDDESGLEVSDVRVAVFDKVNPLGLSQIMLKFGTLDTDLNIVSVAFAPSQINFYNGGLVTDFTNLTSNALSLFQGDMKTMLQYSVNKDGALFVPGMTSVWSTYLSRDGICYNGKGGKYLRIYGKGLAAANAILSVTLRISNGQYCNVSNYEQTIKLSSWNLDPLSGYEYGEISVASFATSGRFRIDKISSLALSMEPKGASIVLRRISFHKTSFAYYPITNSYNLTNFGNLTANALGFQQGDGGSMAIYEMTGGSGAHFKPSTTSSFWKSQLASATMFFDATSKSINFYGQGFLTQKANLSLTIYYSNLSAVTQGAAPLKETVVISSWNMVPSGLERGSAKVSDFKSVIPTKILYLELTFSPPLQDYYLSYISLDEEPVNGGNLMTTLRIGVNNSVSSASTAANDVISSKTPDQIFSKTSNEDTSPVKSLDSGVLIAIIGSGSFIVVAISATFAYVYLNRRRMELKYSAGLSVTSNIPGNSQTVTSIAKYGIMSHSSMKSAEGTTQTLHTQNNAISVPGYLAIDIDTDLEGIEDFSKAGSGGTALIIRARLKNAKLIMKHGFNDVAVKIIKDDEDPENCRKNFLYEIAIMNSLPMSPFVVNLVGYSNQPMALVMKLYLMSLKDMLQRSDYTPLKEIVVKIGHDVASGMNDIHNQGILHLDLKPHNVLIDLKSDLTFNCVICDFGFANFIGHDRQIVAGIQKPLTIGISSRYASPELFWKSSMTEGRFNTALDKKIDVYAYAITLFEVITKTTAWNGVGFDEIQAQVTKGGRPTFPENYSCKSKEIEEIITESWRGDPTARPSFQDIRSRLASLLEPIPEEFTKTLTSNVY